MKDTNGEQLNSMSDLNESAGRLTAGTSSCTATHISSSSYSGGKTLIVYENDESVEIKEEIIDEGHQGGDHNLLSEKNQLDEKFVSSDNKFPPKTAIVYEDDETLEIKEEIIQDPGTVSGQKIEKEYGPSLNTIDTREADILHANKLRTHKKKEIQELKTEPEKKYTCQKCARSYKHRKSLNTHKKFECEVRPQFICKFCDKQFKRKSHLNLHVSSIHQKINSNISQASYTCDKCCLNYGSLRALKRHKHLKHAAVKPEFTCDVCGYKTNMKSSLSKHISSRHFKDSKTPEARHNCDKCCLNYSSLRALKEHKRLKHGSVKAEFTCEVCGYKTNMKSGLSKHISSRHFKDSRTPEARHNCDQCCLNYSSLRALKEHERLKHAAVKPEFTCVICCYKTDKKSSLSRHTSSRHLK